MKKETKKLRIAQVSPLWFPVPPKGYGGTEKIVSQLTENLQKRGHKVTLFASGDSKTKGKLIPIIKTHLRKLGVPYLHDSYNILNLIEAFSRQKEFDIIHTHIDVYDPVFRALSKTPSVATLHNPFWPLSKEKNASWHTYQGRVLIYNRFPSLPYIGISDKYRKLCPAKIKFVKTIYHGVDLKKMRFYQKPEKNCFVWLGRITKLKGIHLAVKLAEDLGFKLLIAGAAVSPEEKKYFKDEITPRLNRKIKFIGEIKSDEEKSRFLGQGAALIYPLCWEEPFGIVMAESMAAGTPVIAFPRGAAPEIIKHGETGFLAKNLAEMKKYIKNIEKISRQECRKRVERFFSLEKMIENHEKTYIQIIKNYVPPKTFSS